MALAMYARSGADHYCTFWTADSITAVTAGRLQTDKKVQARTVLKNRNDQRGQKTKHWHQNTNSLKCRFK